MLEPHLPFPLEVSPPEGVGHPHHRCQQQHLTHLKARARTLKTSRFLSQVRLFSWPHMAQSPVQGQMATSRTRLHSRPAAWPPLGTTYGTQTPRGPLRAQTAPAPTPLFLTSEEHQGPSCLGLPAFG